MREPSEMQLHFNRDTWKTLTDAEVLKAEPQEEPAKPPASSAHAPSAVSQPSDGGTTPERTAQSRPASPVNAQMLIKSCFHHHHHAAVTSTCPSEPSSRCCQ